MKKQFPEIVKKKLESFDLSFVDWAKGLELFLPRFQLYAGFHGHGNPESRLN